MYRFWMVMVVVIVLQSCTTREQGCLDIYASNFELTAEKDCDGCCLYPALNVALSQVWNDSSFNVESPLLDSEGDSFKIIDLKYFLSAWILYGTNDEQYGVDSALLGCIPPMVYSPDAIVADARQFNYQIGIIRDAPTIDSLCVTLGLDNTYPCIEEDTTNAFVELTRRSPLWDPSADALRSIRLVLQRDLQSEIFDTIFIDFKAREEIPFPLTFARGAATALRMSVDYEPWFRNVDAQDINSFAPSIIAGFPGSIFATQ
jgi:hypothetical protein